MPPRFQIGGTPPPVPAGGTRRPDGRIIGPGGQTVWAPSAPRRPQAPAAPPPAARPPTIDVTTTPPGPPLGPTAAPLPAPPAFGPPVGGSPPGVPPAMPTYPTAGGTPAPGAFNDPFSMFLSAVPAMRANTPRQIADAMAQAGGTGNRWGTYAARTAGEIGANAAMQENALLQKTLYDYANNVENRALQAIPYGMGLGQMMDQMAQDRVRLPFQVGAWEQGRMDDYGRLGYQDFMQNRLGWLPMMLQAAMSQGSGSAGQVIPIQNQGSPGLADYASLFAGLFGGFS